METGNIISKLNIKDYNKKLEEILINKPFSEDTKNILLNMLYKIENSYKDYKKTKVYVPMKKDLIEEVIMLIEECKEIQIIKPQDKNTDLKSATIIPEKKQIIAYPNEMAILYSLYKLKKSKYEVLKKYTIIKPSVEKILNTGYAMNLAEIIRDFDGWSWNINKYNIENIFLNFIYQTIIMIVDLEKIEGIDIIKNLKSILKQSTNEKSANDTIKLFLQLSIICNLEQESKEQERLLKIYEELKNDFIIISDKKSFLNQITKNKKIIQKELGQIEMILNNDLLLKQEYINTNKELPQKERVFSLSDFSELKEERKCELLRELEDNNKKQEPDNYIKEKTMISDKINFLEEINLSNVGEHKNEKTICFIKAVLKIIENNIKKAETKKQITDELYKIRYYRKLQVSENEKVEDIKEIKKALEAVEKEAITRACNLKVINIISQDILENYNIISKIINIGIIDLETIQIEARKEETDILFDIYEDKSFEKTITNLNAKDLNIKLNKRIKLFV